MAERFWGRIVMKRAVGALFLVGALSSGPAAWAGPVVDAATEAESLQAEGKAVEALDALESAADALWDASPLAFRTVEVVDTADDGSRTPRTDDTFRPDDTLTVYVEPVGYAYGAEGGDDTIAFSIGLVIENATGQVLVEAPDAFSVAAASAQGNRSFGMTLSVVVPFIRPGEYKAVFSVDDQNSDKAATFEVPLTVVLPASDGSAAPQ
jgi:hypothetical protein